MTKFQNINFSLIAFSAYTIKLLYSGPNFADALVLVALAAVYGYNLHLKSKKPDPVRVDQALREQIDEIQRKIRDTQMQNNMQNKPKFKF